MRIAFLAPEVWPFTPMGCLGEMAHDLSLELAGLGHEMVIISIKPRMSANLESLLEKVPLDIVVPVSWRQHQAEVYKSSPAPGVTNYLIYNAQLFDREGFYGNAYGDYEDNSERFIFFSRAALELLVALDFRPDIIHANNWTTGLVPLYLKSIYRDNPAVGEAASLMTVHNISNQGIFWHYDLPLTSLGWEYFNPDSIEFYGNINLLKAGLVYADMISFPSPTYGRQALSKEYGCGLDGVLLSRRDRIGTVLGGVDAGRWSPANNSDLAANYSWKDLSGKHANIESLRRQLDLPAGGRPLLAIIGRLGTRRGLEVLENCLDDIFAMGLDVAILGQMEHAVQVMLQDFQDRYPERLGLCMEITPKLVHQYMAGSDMLLTHSHTAGEQSQHMCAQLYGTVPVALKMGVMADSIIEHDNDHPGTGFFFAGRDKQDMMEALAHAMFFWHKPEQWQDIMRRGMQQDFSWKKAAASYDELYKQAIQHRRET